MTGKRVLAAAAAVVAGAMGPVVVSSPSAAHPNDCLPGQTVTVPNAVGATARAGRHIMLIADLWPELAGPNIGTVIRHNPPAGRVVPCGSTVTLTIRA